MKFARPDGWKPGLPEVRVDPHVMQRLGGISVDYNGLEDLYRGEQGLSKIQTPVTVLRPFRRNADKQRGDEYLLGLYRFISNRVTVDVEAVRY
jgi:hypothetical protein